jgi:uncharacterized protein VirK/YbjX
MPTIDGETMQLITLRSGLEPKSPWSRACAAIKLQLRAVTAPRVTRAYLALLNSHPALSELVNAQPRLLHKIYRPWLSNRMCGQQRLAALQAHYQFVLQQGWGALVAEAARRPVLLAELPGKSDTRYQLVLRAIVPMERDGELVLQLQHDGILVYSLAFAFVSESCQMAIAVGCIQGPQCGGGLELARTATRELHGMRPKSLLLRLVSQLGHACGCSQLLLVSNANLPVRRSLRLGKVKADYDALWREMGASARADGDYALRCEPLSPARLEDLPSKKRAEARRRHSLMQETWLSMRERLAPVVLGQ